MKDLKYISKQVFRNGKCSLYILKVYRLKGQITFEEVQSSKLDIWKNKTFLIYCWNQIVIIPKWFILWELKNYWKILKLFRIFETFWSPSYINDLMPIKKKKKNWGILIFIDDREKWIFRNSFFVDQKSLFVLWNLLTK